MDGSEVTASRDSMPRTQHSQGQVDLHPPLPPGFRCDSYWSDLVLRREGKPMNTVGQVDALGFGPVRSLGWEKHRNNQHFFPPHVMWCLALFEVLFKYQLTDHRATL